MPNTSGFYTTMYYENTILYGKYRCICQFETDGILPYYKGSTFRGVFGKALKKIVYALK